MTQPLYNNPFFLTSIEAPSEIVSANLVTLLTSSLSGLIFSVAALASRGIQGYMLFISLFYHFTAGGVLSAFMI